MKFHHRALTILGLAVVGVAFVATAAAGDTPTDELANIDREAYSVEVGDVNTTAGSEAKVEVTIRAKSGHKVNAQYPHKLKVEDVPDGLQVDKTLLKKGDGKLVDDKTFVFELPVKATRSGTFTLEAKLKTSVCNDEHCLIKKETVQATIKAN